MTAAAFLPRPLPYRIDRDLVGLSMMCYKIGKRKEDLFRREPAEGTHREVIVFSVPDSKLLPVVIKRKEFVVGIEIFIVFAMAALDLAVVPGRERFNTLVLYAVLFERDFKESLFVGTLRVEAVGKLRAVVRLDAFDGIWKAIYTVFNEFGRRIRIVLFEGFQIAKAAVFINECVLIVIATILFRILDSCSNQARRRNILYIDLNLLPGIVCCFVLFGNVLWIWQLNSHLASFP